MSRRPWVIARAEFFGTARRRAFMVITLTVPVLAAIALAIFVVVQAAGADPDEEPETFGYVDHSGLLEGVQSVAGVPFLAFADRPSGVRALLAGEIEGLVEVPADYVQSGHILEVQQRRGGIPGFGRAERPPVERVLVQRLLAGEVPPEVIERIQQPAVAVVVEVDSEGRPVQEPFDGRRFVFFVTLAGLAFATSIMTSGFFQESLSEEKENRIMEVLLSSATPRELMLGKLVGLGGLGFAQFLFWVACGAVLIGVVRMADLAQLPAAIGDLAVPALPLVAAGLLYFILGYVLLGTLMAAVGAITTSQREAQQVVFLLIVPYIAPLWLVEAILRAPSGTTATILSFVPFTAPITGMMRLGADGIGPLELTLSLFSLSVAVTLAVLLTLRIFRVSLLMYGRRPRLREVLGTFARGRT